MSSTLSVGDHLKILDLYARYTHTVDSADIEAWCACFTDDGALIIPARGSSVVGRAELDAFGQRYNAKVRGRERHVTTNITVAGSPEDPSRATGAAYLLMVAVGHPGVTVRAVGTYQDLLVKEDSRWLFRRRTLDFIV